MDASLAQAPANFGSKRWFCKIAPSQFCIPNLKLLASAVAEISRGSQIFFGCTPSQDPRQFWILTSFFGKLVPNQFCVPNLKLLASTVVEMHRGSQFFLDVSLAHTPANFGPKRCFFGKLVPNPSCVPNVKLLALGPKFFWMLA